jgi:hypothetical protein
LPRAGAVDVDGAGIDGGRQLRVENFQTFERRGAAAADAEHIVGRGHALDIVVGPFGQQPAVAA